MKAMKVAAAKTGADIPNRANPDYDSAQEHAAIKAIHRQQNGNK